MLQRYRLNVLVCLLLLVVCADVHADEMMSKAASHFRDKEYAKASLLAAKLADSPQKQFLSGVTALRLAKYEEALTALAAAEAKLPLVADYAVLYQAEALQKLKRYPEAAAKYATLSRNYSTSSLIRRSEKQNADVYFDAGDYTGAIKLYQSFVEKYPAGSDSVEALYQLAQCKEHAGDKTGAVSIYRTIWLNNPHTAQAKKSFEQLKNVEKAGIKQVSYSVDELLKRASLLSSRNEHSAALQTLQSIAVEGQSPVMRAKIELKIGMASYRLRNWKNAEKYFAIAAASTLPSISSEARFWQAKTLERLNNDEQAFAIYQTLIAEGNKQEFADDAILEAAGIRRSQGRYIEAAQLFEKIPKHFAESKFLMRAVWESGWCRYLAGEYGTAAGTFKTLLKDEQTREKNLYWLARSLEQAGKNSEATDYYRILQDEYPAGFYATWQRDLNGVKDLRETLGQRNAVSELPQQAGFEKPHLLASMGMMEEARLEMAAIRKKMDDKKFLFPALARVYLEMEEYGAAIALFMQNRPFKWNKTTLPLWAVGYPLVYSGLVNHYSAVNGLSAGLILGLMRAESGFSPAIKSPAGALGLMQMMPATAKLTAREKGAFNPQMLVVPEYNIKLGTKHFHDLLKEYDGDVVYAIAAYNAGSGAVERWRKNFKALKKDEFIESIPYQETRDYVKKVYASAATYRQLYGLK